MDFGIDWSYSRFRFEEYESSYLAIFGFDCDEGRFNSRYVAALGMNEEDYFLEVMGVMVGEFEPDDSELSPVLEPEGKLFKFYPHNISNSNVQGEALKRYGELAADDETPFRFPYNYSTEISNFTID